MVNKILFNRKVCPLLKLFFAKTGISIIAALFTGIMTVISLPSSHAHASDKEIVVGGNVNYPPYEFMDKNGNPSGYNVELTRAIASIMGMKVRFKLGKWDEIRKKLEDGEIDALQGMSWSRGRSKVVDFSIPHTMVNHSIYTKKGAAPVRTLRGLSGKEAAFHARGFIHNYLTENRIAVIPVLTSTPAVAINRTSCGRPPYSVVASLPATYLMKEMNIKNVTATGKSVISVKYCYAVKKGNADLLARLNEGLAILKQTGQYKKIHDKWIGVLEPKSITWKQIVKYGSIVIIIFITVLAGVLLWSWTLKKQVFIRTAALEEEVRERKKTVKELKLKQRQLIQADRMATLGTLVSGVAHEINNPNGLILLNMPLILDYFRDTQQIIESYYRDNGDFQVAGLKFSRLQPKIKPKLIEVEESAARIKGIVEDLKDFSRKDDSELEYDVEVNKVISTAIRLVDNTIKKSTSSFESFLYPDIPLLKGNPQRIEQVIVNLIINSCQALSKMEERIRVTTEYSQHKGEVVITVEDEGEGITSQNIQYITDPFFTTKRSEGGTGLGLYMSAGIIKDHNGTIDFKSVQGEGTTAIIRLPVPERREK